MSLAGRACAAPGAGVKARVTMHFVLVHGWGFMPAIWARCRRNLDDAEVTLGRSRLRLRRTSRRAPTGRATPSPSAIRLGCSGCFTGQGGGPCAFRALVSVQGFDCFCPHIPPSRVAGMRRGLDRDPEPDPSRPSGAAAAPSRFALPEALNVERLDEGLGWLMDWDEPRLKAELACPTPCPCRPRRCHRAASHERGHLAGATLSLVARPAAMCYLSKHPEWCANHVLDFAHALQP